MAKLTLLPITNLQNENSVVTTINTNSDRIEAALENTLSRDGTTPNEMNSELDMNNHRIYNLPKATSVTEPIRKKEFDDFLAALSSGETSEALLVLYDNEVSELTATNVQDAIDELDSRIDAFNLGEASSVLYDNTTSELTATNVQDALDEIDGVLDGLVAAGEPLASNPLSTSMRSEGLRNSSQTMQMARLDLGVAQVVPSGTDTFIELGSVAFDTLGGTSDVAGNPAYSITVPIHADIVEVSAWVQFSSSSAGSVRSVQIVKSPAATNGPYTVLKSVRVPPVAITSVEVTDTIRVNAPGDARERFLLRVLQDTGTDMTIGAAAASLSMKALTTKPWFAPKPWLRTIQGFYGLNERTAEYELRDWNSIYQNQFGENYQAMVDRFAGFSVLNLGSVVGFGEGTDFPWVKFHANYAEYPLSSPAFNIAGRTWQQFLTDIRMKNPEIKIFIYTTPAYDDLRAWNPVNGTQSPGTDWSAGGTIPNSPGNFENLQVTLNAMLDSSERLIDGTYLDLMGSNTITAINRDAALRIIKSYGFDVMCNALGASVANAKFLCASPYITYGDYIYAEGFEYDSTNGSTSTASNAMAAYMATQSGRGVRLAAVIEELNGTTDAEMNTNGYNNALDHWVAGYNKITGTYYQPGWLVEHQRAYYDYVGSAGNG